MIVTIRQWERNKESAPRKLGCEIEVHVDMHWCASFQPDGSIVELEEENLTYGDWLFAAPKAEKCGDGKLTHRKVQGRIMKNNRGPGKCNKFYMISIAFWHAWI